MYKYVFPKKSNSGMNSLLENACDYEESVQFCASVKSMFVQRLL